MTTTTTITRSASAMASAIRELHDTAETRLHPAGRPVIAAADLRTSPARRPAPPNAPHARAATRGVVPAQVRRGLAMLALLVIAAVVLSVVLGSVGTGTATAAPELGALAGADSTAATTDEVALVVGPGETVWDLALPYVPAGEDAQLFMAQVLTRNGVEATAVRPGTVIRIPLG
jgi:hypothetical protein